MSMQRSFFFNRFLVSVTFFGALFLFGGLFSPSTALATCGPGDDSGTSPRVVTTGTVSLDAAQNTLTVFEANWYPGVSCDGLPYPHANGDTWALVQGTSLVGPTQHRGQQGYPVGGYDYSGDINVSSLGNGTYTLIVRTVSTYGDPNNDQKTTTFTINRAPSTYDLDVRPATGNSGNGSVTADNGSINCTITSASYSGTCDRAYNVGTTRTLTAVPASGYTFSGWSGSCSGTGSCVVTMNANKTVRAGFVASPPGQYALTVIKAGTGTGTVTSSPTGISCGADCSQSYTSGTNVVLTATPGSGSTFAGWTGTGCTTGTVAMTANRTCTATFNANTAPTADLKMRLSTSNPWSDGPLTINAPASNTTVYIQWLSDAGATCVASSNPENGWWPTGQTITLNANGDGDGAVQVGTAHGPKVFGMTCTKNGQSASDQVTVNVVQPPTATISASPNPVTYGQSTTITWNSTNTTYCYANPEGQTNGFFTGTQPSGSDGTSALYSNGTFAVNCGNTFGGSAGATTTVDVTPRCLPGGQTVGINEPAALNAQGGNGIYSWSAPGGTPSSGDESTLNVSYATAGDKFITVSSDGMTSAACTVTVSPPVTTGTVIVRSFDNLGQPFATTWILSGPPGGYNNELSNQTEKIYYNMPPGLYTIDPADTKNGYTLTDIIPEDSQNLEAGHTIVFVLEYTPDAPAPGASVDIRANGDDGPVYVSEANPMAYLTWTSSDIEPGTCVGTSDNKGVASWDGNPKDDDGVEWSPTITGPITFIITCDEPSGSEGIGGASGTVSDSVIVDLRPPQCSDGEDNDGDKQTDYPNDPGCQSADDDDEANATQCSDNIDNDDPEDELIDMNDPGCSSPQDDDELNQATTVTQCNNGLDDDGDGVIDYDGGGQTLPDPGCESALDPSETDDPDIREI